MAGSVFCVINQRSADADWLSFFFTLTLTLSLCVCVLTGDGCLFGTSNILSRFWHTPHSRSTRSAKSTAQSDRAKNHRQRCSSKIHNPMKQHLRAGCVVRLTTKSQQFKSHCHHNRQHGPLSPRRRSWTANDGSPNGHKMDEPAAAIAELLVSSRLLVHSLSHTLCGSCRFVACRVAACRACQWFNWSWPMLHLDAACVMGSIKRARGSRPAWAVAR